MQASEVQSDFLSNFSASNGFEQQAIDLNSKPGASLMVDIATFS